MRVKQNPKTRNVPVVIYTSNKDDRIRTECEQADCAGYLRHPATLEELYVAIQKATKKPRRFVRLDTFLEVTVGEGNRAAAGEGKDYIAALSELGMFVSTAKPLTYGSVHHFTFFLSNAPGWIIRVEGQVVYNHPNGDVNKLPGAGVKFVKIGSQEREFIKDFIRKKLMEGLAKRAVRPED